MGDDDDGLATVERIEVLHDGPLVVGVERVRRLVKKDVIRLLIHRTGDALREDDTVLHDYSALAAPPFLVERVDVRASEISKLRKIERKFWFLIKYLLNLQS